MEADSSSHYSSSDDDSSSGDDLETDIERHVRELETGDAHVVAAALEALPRSRDAWTGRNDVADGAEHQVAPRRRVARAPQRAHKGDPRLLARDPDPCILSPRPPLPNRRRADPSSVN